VKKILLPSYFRNGFLSILKIFVGTIARTRVSGHDVKFLYVLGFLSLKPLVFLLKDSNSQLRQDLIVLSKTKYMRNGYFVEFGATNGIDLSNTYLLEKAFAWTGILAEPAKAWESDLRNNRPEAVIETSCLWSDSNSILKFAETENLEFSKSVIMHEEEIDKQSMKTIDTYDVRTISLLDLLRKYHAPTHVDYLSIDTEGSEYEILNAFDFTEYSFGVITVEHNYTPQRELIFELLSRNGYKRIYTEISRFDDWYVS
jgi:FkbM family methyltransferase